MFFASFNNNSFFIKRIYFLFLIAFHSKAYDFSIPSDGDYLLYFYFYLFLILYSKILTDYLLADFDKSSDHSNTSKINSKFKGN